MSRPSTRPCLVLALVLGACTSPGTDHEVVKIAVVQDLSAPDADEHAQPALQAIELAVAQTAPDLEIEVVDVSEGPGAVEEIASDPSIVAAIVAPGADGAALAEAGVPTLSVSTAGPTPSSGAWRRLVAPIGSVADAIVGALGGKPTCILSEAPPPDELAGLLTEWLGAPSATLPPEEAAAFARSHACDSVAWAGSPDAGLELAGLLLGVPIVGGDRLLDPDFVGGAGLSAEGTLAACACVDVSTSTDPAALRFIQDYQAEFGTAPGPYAVEAWDATRVVLEALAAGGDRDAVAGALHGSSGVNGLVTTYGFDPAGELDDPGAAVGLSELRSGRWVRL
jgi:branched-chain amino acid transport system substrate-binding protein